MVGSKMKSEIYSEGKVQLEPFMHQVGGRSPIVTLDNKTLYKPLDENEKKFYETMEKSLIPYVPKYEGSMILEVHEENHQKPHNCKKLQNYLILENLVSQYKYPCILDLKVGTRQYGEDDSADKKALKMARTQGTTSACLGLRIMGIQVMPPIS